LTTVLFCPKAVEVMAESPISPLPQVDSFWLFLVSFFDCSKRQLFFTLFIQIFIHSISYFQFQIPNTEVCGTTMAVPEEWVPSLGIGVMVSGFLAFVVGTAVRIARQERNEARRKRNAARQERDAAVEEMEAALEERGTWIQRIKGQHV
jgi:type VI protein secretion system component VasK